MPEWKYNENVTITLPDYSLEAFDKTMNNPFVSAFVPKDCIEMMREKFKEDFRRGR